MQKPVISLVVAIAENGVIGRNGQLPWRLKSELRMFRKLTLNAPVIMGRKTYQSLGKPLDKRDNIVVTGSGFTADGVITARSLTEALAAAADCSAARGGEEIFVIGGAEIFRETLPYASRIYATHVHAKVEGDVFMPEIDPAHWHEGNGQFVAAGEGDDYDYTVITLHRRGTPPATVPVKTH